TKGACPLDAVLHQGNTDALAPERGLDRKRTQQQRTLASDGDRPEAHGTQENAVLADGNQGKSAIGSDAFAQPVGGLGEAAGTESPVDERFNGLRVTFVFEPDVPHGAPFKAF